MAKGIQVPSGVYSGINTLKHRLPDKFSHLYLAELGTRIAGGS